MTSTDRFEFFLPVYHRCSRSYGTFPCGRWPGCIGSPVIIFNVLRRANRAPTCSSYRPSPSCSRSRSVLLQDIPIPPSGRRRRASAALISPGRYLTRLFSLIRSFHHSPALRAIKHPPARRSTGTQVHIHRPRFTFAFANFTEVFYKPSLTNGARGR